MLRRFPTRRSVLKITLVTLFLLLPILFFVYYGHSTTPPDIFGHPYFQYNLDLNEPRNPDLECILPRIHPFHPSIWSYFAPLKHLNCKSERSDFSFIDDKGVLRLNSTELEILGYEPGKSLYCNWCPILRAGEKEDDDDRVICGKKNLLDENGTPLPKNTEIFQVLCTNFAGLTVYEKIHARISNTTSPNFHKTRSLRNPVNVLIFGIDSMSRLSFIRLLPRTYKYLTEHLNMTVFKGMNKVGDNTFPNLIAMLTGWKAYGEGLPDASKNFDDWPLIWKNYSEIGYNTMWAEDFPKFGLFNYLAEGFRSVPTDHYLRPFWLAIEQSTLFSFIFHLCYGSIPKHVLQMNYVREFVSTYGDAKMPYFGFSFLAELSHNYMSRIASADDHFVEFFEFLKDNGHLENTLLIVMSDHGHRFDAIRSTEVGHIEERMPFFSIHIPRSITTLQPNLSRTLELNSGRLITPFDTYATLVDVLHFIKDGTPLGTSSPPQGTLGQSLFKEVPLERTCKGASIPSHYCICEIETTISKSDIKAYSAADATIRHINKLLEEGGQDIVDRCAVLSLKTIRAAHMVQTEASDAKVRIVVETEPSGGIFEATTLIRDSEAEVLMDVSRINPYGNQSDCIKHVILRKYCYCTRSAKVVGLAENTKAIS